jgi:opine dehydrogenase
MNIAIFGGGHGCYAAAADLSEAGHRMRLWRRDAAALESVIRSGGIVLKDAEPTRSTTNASGCARHTATPRRTIRSQTTT